MVYETYEPKDDEAVSIEGASAEVLPIGYHLGTEETRSGLWVFDEGDTGRRHRQNEQEELYYVVEGRVKFEMEDESVVVDENGFIMVSPDEPRRLVAEESSKVFVVGAPNVKDDHEVLE